MATWILTREWADAEPQVERLRAAGLSARALPCIERRALPWPEELAPPHAAAGPVVVLCTSPFGAGLVVERWPRLRAQAGDAELCCAAMAPVSARVLEEAGLPVAVRAKGGVVALARALGAWLDARPGASPSSARAAPAQAAQGPGPAALVLVPTSDLGEEAPEHEEALALLAPRARVLRRAVYRTSPAPGLDLALRALEPDAAPVFFSPSAVTAWLDAAKRAGLAPPATAVCLGASTARAFERATGRAPLEAPRGAELVDFLRAHQEARP